MARFPDGSVVYGFVGDNTATTGTELLRARGDTVGRPRAFFFVFDGLTPLSVYAPDDDPPVQSYKAFRIGRVPIFSTA